MVEKGGAGTAAHTSYTEGASGGSHAVLKGCIKEVCKVSPWFEALRTVYKNQDSRIGRQACTKIRIGGKTGREGRFAVFFFFPFLTYNFNNNFFKKKKSTGRGSR